MTTQLRFLSKVIFSLSIFVAGNVGAQHNPGSNCGGNGCGYAQFTCGASQHKFSCTGASSANAHSDCTGQCPTGEVCHPVCEDTFAGNTVGVETYRAVLAAANAGNVPKVLELAARLPTHVALNASRKSIQVKSCAGEFVIASLRVRSDSQLQLASRLPAIGQILALGPAVSDSCGQILR